MQQLRNSQSIRLDISEIEKQNNTIPQILQTKVNQMPNIGRISESISKVLTKIQNSQNAFCSTIQMKYAFRQLQLNTETSKQIHVFYVFTDMPVEFQKSEVY